MSSRAIWGDGVMVRGRTSRAAMAALPSLAMGLLLLATPTSGWGQTKTSPNFKHPQQGTVNHFTVTVCDTGAPGWKWSNPYNIKGPGEVRVTNSGSGQHAGVRSSGTDGSVEIIGNSVGENTVEFDITQDSSGASTHVTLKIFVINCNSPRAGGGPPVGPGPGPGPGRGQRAAAGANAARGGGPHGDPPPPLPFPGGDAPPIGNAPPGGQNPAAGPPDRGAKNAKDFKHPQQVGANEFTITVCDTGTPGYVWKNPYNIHGPGTAGGFNQGSGKHGAVRSHGTDGSVEVIGNSAGENTVDFNITQDSDGATVHVVLHIIVIDCGPPKRSGLGILGHFSVGVGVGGGDHGDEPHNQGHPHC